MRSADIPTQVGCPSCVIWYAGHAIVKYNYIYYALLLSLHRIQCCVCTLQLNSSSHIARSHHHLFPVPTFEEYVLLERHGGSSAVFAPVSASEDRDMAAQTASQSLLEDEKGKVEGADAEKLTLSDKEMHCAGCLVGFLSDSGGDNKKVFPVEEVSVFRCPRCRSLFCSVCDVFIHESLHNCPCCCSGP